MCFGVFSLPQTPSFFLGTTILHISLYALFFPFRCFDERWRLCVVAEKMWWGIWELIFYYYYYYLHCSISLCILAFIHDMRNGIKKKKILRNFLFFETKPRQDIPWRGHKIFSFFLEWCRGGGQEPISFLFFVQNFLIYFIGHSDVLMRLDSASFLSYRWPCSAITGQSLHF